MCLCLCVAVSRLHSHTPQLSLSLPTAGRPLFSFSTENNGTFRKLGFSSFIIKFRTRKHFFLSFASLYDGDDISDSFPQLNFPAEASNEEINDEREKSKKN